MNVAGPILAFALASASLLGPALAQEATATSAASPLSLRLEDAWQMALENNLGLEIESVAEQGARFDLLGSWGAFDPVFDLSTSYTDGEQAQNSSVIFGTNVLQFDRRQARAGLALPITTGGRFELGLDLTNTRSNSTTQGNENTDTSATVSFVQPLLRGAGSRVATAQQEIARLSYTRQRARLAEVRERMLLDVHNAYWDLVASLEELEVRRRALGLGQEQLRQNRERLRVGVGTEVDVLQAETNVATREEQLLLAENQVAQRQDALKVLIFGEVGADRDGHRRSDWGRNVVPLTGLPIVLDAASPEVWLQHLDKAFENRPDLASRRVDIASAEVALVQRASERDAALDLTLTASSSASDASIKRSLETGLQYDFPTYSATLSYSVPLRNRAASFAERRARADLRSAHLAYAALENQVVSEVRNALREVHYQAQAVAAATKSRQFAERQLEAEQVRYREGLSTTFQVLEFQQTLSESLSSEQAARANLAKARSALSHAEGGLGASLGLGPPIDAR